MARKKLSRNKAVGIDLLPDKHFHNEILWTEMGGKILSTFNNWVNSLNIPSYVKRAKIIPLSKDSNNSAFPILGELRTIAVNPAISKLYELCILQQLREEIVKHRIIHEYQRGFVPGKSCEDNLVDLTECMKKAKDIE